MKQLCKCHGVSGSCTMKICWQVMPDFRIVGQKLLASFDQAISVRPNRKRSHLTVRRTNDKRTRDVEKLNKDDLVYITKSPNFCENNKRLGLVGTQGRKCVLYSKNIRSLFNNASISESESCSKLCCGRGYTTKIVDIEEDCDCQFKWCCSVQCKKCKKRIMDYYCK